VYRFTLSLLLSISIPVSAQLAGSGVYLVPILPEPTAYGLEIIRAEHWQAPAPGDRNRLSAAMPAQQNSELDNRRDSISDYRVLIEELEIEKGPYTDELSEALAGLGHNYQNRGDHENAIDAFRRSIHLTRINRSPFAEEQIPLLNSLRESLLAERMWGELDQLQEYIYLVHRRALEPGDSRLEQATQNYVAWQRSAYLQNIGDIGSRLLTLSHLFSKALLTLEQQSAPHSLRLPQLHETLQLAYLLDLHDDDQQPEFTVQVRQPGMSPAFTADETRLQRLQEQNYRSGLRAAKNLVEAAEQEAPGVRAEALVARGDWYQWQDKRISARRSYTEAYNLLTSTPTGGQLDNERRKLFDEPTELPDDFIYLPNIQFDERKPRGRAKVRFTVSRDGRLRDLEVLELSPEDRGAEIALRKMLRRLYFRPRLEDGEAMEAVGVEREYIFFDKP
jgi:TonB family protein